MRAHELLPQLAGRRRLRCRPHGQRARAAAPTVSFKKTVFADNLAVVVDRIYGDPTSAGGLDVLVATLAFGVQIYADFSGYTDIARGSARLLGIRAPDQLRRALLRDQHHRLLAPLAHHAVALATGLSLHPARRRPAVAGARLREPHAHDGPRRALARRERHVRDLGRVPRTLAGRGTRPPLRRTGATRPSARDADDVRPGPRRVGDLSRRQLGDAHDARRPCRRRPVRPERRAPGRLVRPLGRRVLRAARREHRLPSAHLAAVGGPPSGVRGARARGRDLHVDDAYVQALAARTVGIYAAAGFATFNRVDALPASSFIDLVHVNADGMEAFTRDMAASLVEAIRPVADSTAAAGAPAAAQE